MSYSFLLLEIIILLSIASLEKLKTFWKGTWFYILPYFLIANCQEKKKSGFKSTSNMEKNMFFCLIFSHVLWVPMLYKRCKMQIAIWKMSYHESSTPDLHLLIIMCDLVYKKKLYNIKFESNLDTFRKKVIFYVNICIVYKC